MSNESSSPDRQIQLFQFESNEIRAIRDPQGNPLFVAGDVCRVLDLQNVTAALNRLDDDERGLVQLTTLGGPQQTAVVSESGLYSLILGSRKPNARDFKRWITHEVLPAIRKTGSYMTQPTTPAQAVLALAQQLVDQETRLLQQDSMLTDHEDRLRALEAEYVPQIDFYTVSGFLVAFSFDPVSQGQLATLSVKARAWSQKRNIPVGQVRDSRGYIDTYHVSILHEVTRGLKRS
jgi:prophage antirepressor-like protein